MKATQYRGHCQCCGKEQAVPNSFMSKHGYTVKQGWFVGVCSGDRHEPIEVNREYADKLVASIRAEVPELLAKAELVKAGKLTPKMVEVGYSLNKEVVPFEEAHSYDQRRALQIMEYGFRNRASAGEDFANALEEIANKYHGQPLMQVVKKEGPTPIQHNEIKVLNGRNVVCKNVHGARVYFKYENISSNLMGWVSTTKWRSLQSA
jgi:hypothetical protein